MKISLALGPQQPLDRQTAWGCVTTNLAVPGMGSLVAGRKAGYFQLGLAMLSMILTVMFGARFALWLFSNWSRVYQSDTDPVGALMEMWRQLRWTLASIGLFGASWLWALGTSFSILNSAHRPEQGQVPPRFD